MSSFSDPYVNVLQTFYNDVGEKYDAETHSFHSETARCLVEAANPAIKEGSWVLDLATGTGNVTFAAAPKVTSSGRILGIDISDKFLEIAAKGAEKLNVDSFVQFSHQDVTALKLPQQYPKRCFDAVTCGSAIALFPDQKAVINAAATELLKPGGLFAVDMHGTHLPVKMFLDVAVPRGFKPPFDPAWIDQTESCLNSIFKDSEFEIQSSTSRGVAAGTMKWDASTVEATEKMWKNIVVDSPWASFGIENVSEEIFADIKEAWKEEVEKYKNVDGFIVGTMTQYIVVAALKQA